MAASAGGCLKPTQPAAPAPARTAPTPHNGRCENSNDREQRHEQDRDRGRAGRFSGYAGDDQGTAHYELVGSGRTGHAESVQITYDPKQVSFGTLLRIHFSVAHDPTTLNRQGPDSGPQYRSAVFYRDAQQKRVTESYIAQLDAAKVFPAKIVTQVAPLTAFYPAEGYHQDYATRHPDSPYIALFDLPKIANLKATLPQLYREAPVLVSAQSRQ